MAKYIVSSIFNQLLLFNQLKHSCIKRIYCKNLTNIKAFMTLFQSFITIRNSTISKKFTQILSKY
jgi:hypothetical protein